MIRQVKSCHASARAERWNHRLMNHDRLRRIVWDTLYGVESNIPICCVLEYIWRSVVLKQAPAMDSLWRQGLESQTGFVPCAIHKRLGWAEPLTPWMRDHLRCYAETFPFVSEAHKEEYVRYQSNNICAEPKRRVVSIAGERWVVNNTGDIIRAAAATNEG